MKLQAFAIALTGALFVGGCHNLNVKDLSEATGQNILFWEATCGDLAFRVESKKPLKGTLTRDGLRVDLDVAGDLVTEDEEDDARYAYLRFEGEFKKAGKTDAEYEGEIYLNLTHPHSSTGFLFQETAGGEDVEEQEDSREFRPLSCEITSNAGTISALQDLLETQLRF